MIVTDRRTVPKCAEFDVERSKQFVVINEVELQRATQTNAPASAEEPVQALKDPSSACN